MKKYGFGVDVGGTTVKMGFFETSGELLDKWEIKTDTSDNGKAVLPDIAQAIDNKLAQEGISKSDVEGVGIGVPGPVRSDGVVNGVCQSRLGSDQCCGGTRCPDRSESKSRK